MPIKITKKGETLVEVITALTSLVIAAVASVTIIMSTYHSSTISREYLIAQNLAREAIEGMTNIRDTNWLLYPSERELCWLTIDGDCNTGTKAVENGIYIIDRTPTGKFKMDKENGLLNLSDPNNKQTNDLFQLFTDVDQYFTTNKVNTTPTNWYRMIVIEKADETTPFTEAIKINTTVQWGQGSAIETYTVSTILTNYAK